MKSNPTKNFIVSCNKRQDELTHGFREVLSARSIATLSFSPWSVFQAQAPRYFFECQSVLQRWGTGARAAAGDAMAGSGPAPCLASCLWPISPKSVLPTRQLSGVSAAHLLARRESKDLRSLERLDSHSSKGQNLN